MSGRRAIGISEIGATGMICVIGAPGTIYTLCLIGAIDATGVGSRLKLQILLLPNHLVLVVYH